MKLKQTLQQILEKHNLMAGENQIPLFQLLSPYILYQKLDPGSPYRSDDLEAGTDPGYVERCTKIAEKLYKDLAFGRQLLIVYEDLYSENNPKEISFVESCLIEGTEAKTDVFSWKDRPMEADSPATGDPDEENYLCTRRLYAAKEIDIRRLFREIILSDIGGQYELASKESVSIVDAESARIFRLYDDRGIMIYAPEEYPFSCIGTEHDDILDSEANFLIRTGLFHWIGDSGGDTADLCLHGLVSVDIGAEKLSYPCTVNAAALRMLKTLTEEHTPEDCGEQMLPCCGHSLFANEALDEVRISGCNHGIDWAVRHEGDHIRLITLSGRETLVGLPRYRRVVCRFADAVESFYQGSTPKAISPGNDIDRNGWTAFWNEWHRRRGAKKQ